MRRVNLLLLLASIVSIGCGSDFDPLTPTDQVETTTITIGESGVSPRHVVVNRGARVTFVNSASRNHNIASTPHPAHTDCAEVNEVGFLVPGQSRQTAPLDRAGLCGFHDHDLNERESLMGTIEIR